MSNKRKNFPFLKEIPPHVLLKVVSKQTSKERIAMRKTCKFLNNFCEENRDELGKTFLNGGLSLILTTNGGKVHFFNSRGTFSFLSYLGKENPVDDAVQKKFSGLAIKEVEMYDYVGVDFEKIVSDVKKMNLHVQSVDFSMERTPQEQMELINIIDATDSYWCRCDDNLKEYIEIIHHSPKVSKLYVTADCSNVEVDMAMVEKMKTFHSFELSTFNTNYSFFHGFINGLGNAHDFSLESVLFKFDSVPGETIFMPFPAMTTLFNQNTMEKKYKRSEFNTIHVLRKDELSIVLREERSSRNIHLNFFSRKDEAGILRFVAESLDLKGCFTEANEGEYINGDDEKRSEILTTIFMQKWKKREEDERKQLEEEFKNCRM